MGDRTERLLQIVEGMVKPTARFEGPAELLPLPFCRGWFLGFQPDPQVSNLLLVTASNGREVNVPLFYITDPQTANDSMRNGCILRLRQQVWQGDSLSVQGEQLWVYDIKGVHVYSPIVFRGDIKRGVISVNGQPNYYFEVGYYAEPQNVFIYDSVPHRQRIKQR